MKFKRGGCCEKGVEGRMHECVHSNLLRPSTVYPLLWPILEIFWDQLAQGLLFGDPKGQPWLCSRIWPHLRLTLTHHISQEKETLVLLFRSLAKPLLCLDRLHILVGWFGPKSEMISFSKPKYDMLSFITGENKNMDKRGREFYCDISH